MPVEFLSKPLDGHPITELQYDLTTNTVDVGGMSLNLTTLSHVEKSIDHVFHWLESKGRDATEIERLAPYFGVVWPSALALTGYLIQDRVKLNLNGKRVLELGCGLALPSMICSKLGAVVTATDNHPDVPRFLERNISLNEPCEVLFADSSPQSANDPQVSSPFDYVIASDVLYEKHLVEVFAEDVTRFSKPDGVAVIADPGRPYIQGFVTAMVAKGWSDELQPWTVYYQGKPHDIYLLIFRRG